MRLNKQNYRNFEHDFFANKYPNQRFGQMFYNIFKDDTVVMELEVKYNLFYEMCIANVVQVVWSKLAELED